VNQYAGVLAPHLPQGVDRTSSGSGLSARCRCRSCLDSGSSICTAVAPDAVFTVRTQRHRVALDPITASRPPFGPPILSQVANAASAAAAMVDAREQGQHP